MASNLKQLRYARGYTQEKLAELCQLHKNYISEVEPGEDGSLWAAYEVQPAVLVRGAVSGYAG